MGGQVGLRRQLGQGSEFWFSARLRRDGAATGPVGHTGSGAGRAGDGHGNDDATRTEHAAQALRQLGEPAQVLLVEDNPVNQMLIMDGLTAARRLREMPAYARTPILAMTANALVEDHAACLDAGMSGYLGKPIDPLELYTTVLQALRSPPAA